MNFLAYQVATGHPPHTRKGPDMTQLTHRIELGQEYANYNAGERATTRIRVISKPYPGYLGISVDVVTLTDTGRQIRRRAISIRKLHAEYLTRSGKPRRTGYWLVKDADGTPA